MRHTLRAVARSAALLSMFLVSLAVGSAELQFTVRPTTTDETGKPLPPTGPGALTAHRFEYGTCNGSAFGTAIAEKIIAMPAVNGSFPNVPIGMYCGRAFPRNQFAEGKPYPVSIIGPAPSDGGSIIVLRQVEP